jgi:hypothetical protein
MLYLARAVATSVGFPGPLKAIGARSWFELSSSGGAVFVFHVHYSQRQYRIFTSTLCGYIGRCMQTITSQDMMGWSTINLEKFMTILCGCSTAKT